MPIAMRVSEAEEDTVGSEFIHLRLEGEPSVNIISVYLEPGISGDCAKKTHKILEDEVQKCVDSGEECLLMGDMNAAVNENTRSKTASRKFILEWEESGKIKILNQKNEATRVPRQAGYQANCIDLGLATPGLEESGVKFTLAKKKDWTPTEIETTGMVESMVESMVVT